MDDLTYILTYHGRDCLGFPANLYFANKDVFKKNYWVSDLRLAKLFEDPVHAISISKKLRYGYPQVKNYYDIKEQHERENIKNISIRLEHLDIDQLVIDYIKTVKDAEDLLLVRPYIVADPAKQIYKERLKQFAPHPTEWEIILWKTAIL